MTAARRADRDAGLFRTEAARNYLFIGLASLLTVAAVLFVRGSGSLPAAFVPTGLAAVGLLLRWPAMPVIVLFVLVYFLLFPFGVPMGFGPNDVRGSALRMLDLVLAGGVLAYFASHYRLLGLTRQAVPPDGPAWPTGTTPTRRPAALVADNEFARLFATIGACVVAGQVLWAVVASLGFDFVRVPPLTFRSDVFATPRATGDGGDDSMTQRLLVFGALAGALGLAAGITTWFWRLSRLSRAEGDMILLDAQWREHRRELNRQEKWRAWSVQRARRKAGYADDLPPPPPKKTTVWGCLRVAILVVLTPIAVVLMGRLFFQIYQGWR